MTDDQLAKAVADAALLHGSFTLRSGRTSKYYLDKYRFTCRPDILKELGERIAARAEGWADLLAGPELGGVPLASAGSLASGLPMVLVRNAKKDYGTSKQIEGDNGGDVKGKRVLITEDIATSGGQAVEAATLLRDELGAAEVRVLVVVDREEGGRAAVEGAGFAFDALLTKSDLGIDE